MNLDDILRAELARLEAADLRRVVRPPLKDAIDFASNDYLGLAGHPALREAANEATEKHGTGARASRLITGTGADVLDLEERLAAWKEKEAALVFGSGYAAALGTIPALVGRGDTIILDKLCHASLIDAARLSGATVRVVPHGRVDQADKLLARRSGDAGRTLLVTESLFSMDGDVAPLAEWVAVKERHGAWLLVDEAHATGVYGPTGAGLIAEAGLSAGVEIVLGTLSKALGGVGGYIAGSRPLIDWLINRARSFIYSTALPPGAIAAARAAVELASGAEGAERRTGLQTTIQLFRTTLPAPWESRAQGAIQPLICGEAAAALRLAAALRDKGLIVPAIRYPTVARHAARLRVTLSAVHGPSDVARLVEALGSIENGSSIIR